MSDNILRDVKEIAETEGLAKDNLYNPDTKQYCMIGAIAKQMGVDSAVNPGNAYHVVKGTAEIDTLAKVISENYPDYRGYAKMDTVWLFNDNEPLDNRVAMLDKAAVEFDARI